MNDKIKQLLVGYYKKANDNFVIPQILLNEVLKIILDGGCKKITQFIYFENAYNEHNVFEALSQVASSVRVTRYYTIQYLKQMRDKKLEFILARDKKYGIESSVCALSKAHTDELPPFSEFIVFDDNCAIINRSIFETENILTEDKSAIENCNKWISFGLQQRELIYSQDFLQEPLMQSADMLYEVSSLCCTHNHVDKESCEWYHSIWQYLRLLDMVSTPSWHHDFYVSHLLENIEDGGTASAFISGTADYSILAYLLYVVKKRRIDADITVIDLCETPLFACRWYANKAEQKITTLRQSIFDIDEHKKYDLVCADAFLTRFKKDDLRSVLKKWYILLNDNGIVVTTVRIHDEKHVCPSVPTEEAVLNFRKKAELRMTAWERHINLTAEEMGDRAERYARKMVSNCLGTKEDILNEIVACGLCVKHIEDVELSGELYPSRYIRVVLAKN